MSSSEEEEDDTIIYPTLTEACPGRFTTGKKGSPVLIDPNCYDYRRNKVHDKVTNWTCALKPKCKATCVTRNEDNLIIRWTNHTHDPDPIKLKVWEAEREVLEAAAAHPKLSTSHLVAEWQKKTIDPSERCYLPSKRTMERKLKRKKRMLRAILSAPRSLMTWITFQTSLPLLSMESLSSLPTSTHLLVGL